MAHVDSCPNWLPVSGKFSVTPGRLQVPAYPYRFEWSVDCRRFGRSGYDSRLPSSPPWSSSTIGRFFSLLSCFPCCLLFASVRRRRRPPQHRLHLLRRPCLSGDRRYDRGRNDTPKSTGWPGRGCGSTAARAQLDLRAEPRHGPHRQVQPPQRLLQQQSDSRFDGPADPRSCSRPRATRRRSSASGTSSPTPGFDHWQILPARDLLQPADENGDGTVEHQGYTTDIITDLSLDWLNNSATRPSRSC